ncbi:cytochrome d ubiquinol oxidase subunit II [Dactylosporangium sp. NPDC050688]|uniref:cytochrome d ubiquinol oxidase subunit II n=1 Tax=Dactylosporangium sp. NPDC050688 TaxID=3157217 RepID=UPI0033CF3EEE
MNLPDAVLTVMFLALIAYALFGGADFGAGIWDLLAGGTAKGRPQRTLIEHSIGPVWEANHVWLIFVLVVLWTGFPPAFAAIASTLYIPLTLAGFGMIVRGGAFAFRKTASTPGMQRFLGGSFALSSVVTPFFLGAMVGGIASGRVPPGVAAGSVLTSWINPTSVLGGVLAVLSCAYLAAAFLCGDARREAPDLAEVFRRRALITAFVTGAVAIAGIFVLRGDAPVLFDQLLGRGLAPIVLSAAAGAVSIGLLLGRRYIWARVAAGAAVTAVLCGWAAGQYPYVLPAHLTIDDAAAGRGTLTAVLVAVAVGSILLIPALILMYRMFQTVPAATPHPPGLYADHDHTGRGTPPT